MCWSAQVGVHRGCGISLGRDWCRLPLLPVSCRVGTGPSNPHPGGKLGGPVGAHPVPGAPFPHLCIEGGGLHSCLLQGPVGACSGGGSQSKCQILPLRLVAPRRLHWLKLGPGQTYLLLCGSHLPHWPHQGCSESAADVGRSDTREEPGSLKGIFCNDAGSHLECCWGVEGQGCRAWELVLQDIRHSTFH